MFSSLLLLAALPAFGPPPQATIPTDSIDQILFAPLFERHTACVEHRAGDGLPFAVALRNEVTRTVDDLGRRLGADRGAWLPAAHPNRDGLEPLAMAPGC